MGNGVRLEAALGLELGSAFLVSHPHLPLCHGVMQRSYHKAHDNVSQLAPY